MKKAKSQKWKVKGNNRETKLSFLISLFAFDVWQKGFNVFINNFKIAFRYLYRNKGFTLINIFGLAVGIASCILIVSFVQKYQKNIFISTSLVWFSVAPQFSQMNWLSLWTNFKGYCANIEPKLPCPHENFWFRRSWLFFKLNAFLLSKNKKLSQEDLKRLFD